MNPANTEVGKLLSGKEAEFSFNKLNNILVGEIATARAKQRGGLNREQYDASNRKIEALTTAQVVLKSVQIYQAQ
jgi:hypothetical protein